MADFSLRSAFFKPGASFAPLIIALAGVVAYFWLGHEP
jgi:hypothetical protein